MSVQKTNGPIIDPALCRCCRAIKKCRILTAEYNWMGKKEIYADMVMDCYGILLSHVDDNERDSGVCATCVVRLREAAAFRRQVLQCEELFLQAKLAPPEEEPSVNYENKLKKLELESIELKTEPKDYNSDHNSLGDDRDEALPYSDDEDNKPLKPEAKPSEPLKPLKDEDLKSEDSEDFNGSSSDSDEPIKKKAKRKKKSNGKDKEGKKKVKKQKADTELSADIHTVEIPPETPFEKTTPTEEIPPETPDFEINTLTEEIHIKEEIQIEYSDSDSEYSEAPNVSGVPEFRKRRMWVRDRSEGVSEYELLNGDNDEIFYEHTNMSKSSFEELHNMVELLIEKTDTNFRKCISPRERLAICLRHLRTGDSFKDISTKYRVGRTTVSQIVKDVSRALWGTLQPMYMPAPREHTWREAKKIYTDTLNFPNCVGSIGGRHIIAKQTKKDIDYPKVSEKACHKRYVTIALVAVTDLNNRIVALDIGNYAKDGANILENSKFYAKYMENKDFLPWTPLPGDSELTPHVLISNTFTTRHNLLRLFPKTYGYTPERKIFNQYLSQAYTVDRTFEMLMNSWNILHTPMETHVESAVAILKAICCLHNYVLAKHGTSFPTEPKKRPKKGRKRGRKLTALQPLKPTNNRACNAAMAVRDRFLAYFNRLGPLELDLDDNESLDLSDSEGGTHEQNEDITMGHFMDQILPNVETMEDQTSNVTLDIKVERIDPIDSIDNIIESPNKPTAFVDNMAKSSNEAIGSVYKTIVPSNEPTGSVDMLRSSNEPIDDNMARSTDSIDITVEPLNEPTDSIDITVEPLNEPTDSIDITVEPLNEPTDSIDLTGEPLNEPTDSIDITVEPLNEPTDSIDITVEPLNEPTNSVNKSELSPNPS